MPRKRLTRPFDKVNVSPVVRDHYGTLVDARGGRERDGQSRRGAAADLAVMLGLPVAAGVTVTLGGVRAYGVSVLASAVTIFAVLMFSLLVLALNMMLEASAKARDDGATTATRHRAWIAHEFGSNVAYAVLVAVTTATIVVILAMAVTPDEQGTQALSPWATGLVTTLLVHLGLTLLMVLKRVHMIMRAERLTARTAEGSPSKS